MKPSISRIRHNFQRYKEEIEIALDFCEWLDSNPLDLGKPSVLWHDAVFRIVYKDFNPLSVAGSLAAGGRFNIGGAQMNSFFPHLTIEACLYGASSLQCAKNEVGDFLGKARFFALKPNKIFNLWDLQFLIKNLLLYPRLEASVNSSPLVAIWAYQKVPKISQLLASFLRSKGGDGLIYPSTKDSEGKILAFFAKDDEYIKHHFTVSELVG